MLMKTASRKLKKPLIAVLAALAVIVAVYSLTTAWITGTPINPIRFMNLDDFSAEQDVYFFNGSVRTEITGYQDTNGAITVSLNSADTNYIGNLRANVNFSGSGIAFMRVKMLAEWSSGASVMQADTALPFVIDDDADTGNTNKWYDNRENDYCVYYTSAPSASTISVIRGFDADGLDMETLSSMSLTVKLAFRVDAVQFNRYKQIWEMDSLPWR